ncbi:transposase [Paraburkholderia sp. GAS199]|uniref:transposase n=1 Tax=Paraburkholderia sp. GAS199 TaxID=3035126 RepID=UPI003D251A3E
MFYDELSNDEWALLEALVSDEPAVRLNRRGRPRAEPRIVANAVLWIMTTGEPWSKLPGRYPSGPTCRRRFEEWQLNGTLLDMVRLLSGTGRTFAYVPQPAPPVAAKPAAPVTQTPGVREEPLRGVSWKSPESWQAPDAPGRAGAWRSADPIADITRQLSGLANIPPPVSRTPASRPVMRTEMRAEMLDMTEAGAVGAAMHGLDSAIHAARDSQHQAHMQARYRPLDQYGNARHNEPRHDPYVQPDDPLAQLPATLAPRGTQIADQYGYVIYVAAEQVPNAMYRAWAEIMKDGKRVERSGLVGPRFGQAAEAEQYALDWARQWIDRECRTEEAAAGMQTRAASDHQAAVPVARPLPAMRHVPEPVAASHGHHSHGGPAHGPLNAFRGPLRRYPGEPAAAGGASSSESNASGSTSGNASDRYPSSFPELISHAG